ncbi:MAG: hypothetical protein AAGG68_24650 [Bacteroidota bacterium]
MKTLFQISAIAIVSILLFIQCDEQAPTGKENLTYEYSASIGEAMALNAHVINILHDSTYNYDCKTCPKIKGHLLSDLLETYDGLFSEEEKGVNEFIMELSKNKSAVALVTENLGEEKTQKLILLPIPSNLEAQLEIPEVFAEESLVVVDFNGGCPDGGFPLWSQIGEWGNSSNNCFCHTIYSCYFEGTCMDCRDENINILDGLGNKHGFDARWSNPKVIGQWILETDLLVATPLE